MGQTREKLRRLLRHLWLDADDARRALGEPALDRLEARLQRLAQRAKPDA